MSEATLLNLKAGSVKIVLMSSVEYCDQSFSWTDERGACTSWYENRQVYSPRPILVLARAVQHMKILLPVFQQ